MTKSKSAQRLRNAQPRALDEARSKYLDNASQLLFASSPSTSAFLQHERQNLFHNDDLLEHEESQHRACPTCGTILITGITSRMLNQRSNTRSEKVKGGPPASNATERVVYTECYKCNSKTKKTIEKQVVKRKPYSNVRINKSESQTSPFLQPSFDPESFPSAPKAKGKKRPRKPDSLRALLARSKAESSATADQGFGLDLKDLFKED